MIELLQQYGPAYLYNDGNGFSGLTMTLWLFVVSMVLGLLLSLPLALARTSRHVWLRLPVQLYTFVFRGTPLYIQLLICYTGLYSLQVVREHMLLDQFFRNALNCTLLAFVLNTCAYTVEIFAGAIRNLPAGELEAAQAYGLRGWKLNLFLVLPAALRRSLPAYSNELILMLHATSLAFTATVADILKVARDANAATFLTFQAFGVAALLYMLLSFALVGLFRLAERRWMRFLDPARG
ncbi:MULTISPECIES: histidine ABC transporter permease HisM [Pseudomonas]|uniref:Histidine/lysine/arginine/ornithine transport system permease protein HisM n=2 Tax=Pseudomonas TaxID=286 RepID=A0ABM7CPI3_9PSED|nr:MULTISPECIES: histidine ABC transporter permease HisM [Pseudomonas]AZL68031.1 histidine ABC transporter permease HisM [Pseudomonas oryziphila]AZL73304.1 histidine ABC transporter permease HisM [Pseudomonas oryziphila]MDZ4017315.1 Histidine transport system permease protein HisM [Pseudomonas sichuanensis]UVK84909.1 histidine ABC transporter permease HisM [Pseudomonas sichuanensis]UVL91129.1 histidine ABC transporter permease HisM [Pseudomonas sichuanensis]